MYYRAVMVMGQVFFVSDGDGNPVAFETAREALPDMSALSDPEDEEIYYPLQYARSALDPRVVSADDGMIASTIGNGGTVVTCNFVKKYADDMCRIGLGPLFVEPEDDVAAYEIWASGREF